MEIFYNKYKVEMSENKEALLAEKAEEMTNPDKGAIVDDKPISSRIKSVIPWLDKQFRIDSKEA